MRGKFAQSLICKTNRETLQSLPLVLAGTPTPSTPGLQDLPALQREVCLETVALGPVVLYGNLLSLNSHVQDWEQLLNQTPLVSPFLQPELCAESSG